MLDVHWIENNENKSAHWRSESGALPPARVVVADDRMSADAAIGLARQGIGLLWRGDYHRARALLQAMGRRMKATPKVSPADSPAHVFHLHRQARSRRARTLGMLLVPFERGFVMPLRRAPDVRQACVEAYDTHDAVGELPFVTSLREVLGIVGAHEWRRKGVEVPALGSRIHPHYGVFSPVRGEYVDLVAQVPLPSRSLAFDIGTGTGVLAAVLARRGVRRVVATDRDRRAVACARDNIGRLGLEGRVEVLQTDLFPPGRAALIVCNPPWIPAKAASPLDHAVFDPGNRMLRGFVGGLAGHLEPGGVGWLIISDLAEHLSLRSRAELLSIFDAAGLRVVGKLDVRPRHPRVFDEADALHAARSAETTSLWRLVHS
ncbi:methyltransferase [Sinosporangium siamense]|uniref:Methylase n=1 Tax=Sinosporangium siamense TaxID=1367973 RepID=A0A919R9T6_9ACTN|nr:class I SAM-dependent methyltransferase [Sinosporangium siamense]GII89983.1 methylase [Sinosporangium siamense]